MGNLNICFAYKRTIQNILKLGVNSSPSVVYFVAGSLPGTAILELKQLTLCAGCQPTPSISMPSEGPHAKVPAATFNGSPSKPTYQGMFQV